MTELISMDPIDTIYPPYRFSFCEKGLFWTFDVRALLASRSTSRDALTNPYTQIVLSEDCLAKLQNHVQWLNSRRYRLDYAVSDSNRKPTYSQRVTELCLLMDSHGYWTNVDWFNSMTPSMIHDFTNRLDSLWIEELGLTDEQREAIYPSWDPEDTYLVPPINGLRRAMARAMVRFVPIGPLLEQLLTFLFVFLRASPEKESRSLACVYILKALAAVNVRVINSYPWL